MLHGKGAALLRSASNNTPQVTFSPTFVFLSQSQTLSMTSHQCHCQFSHPTTNSPTTTTTSYGCTCCTTTHYSPPPPPPDPLLHSISTHLHHQHHPPHHNPHLHAPPHTPYNHHSRQTLYCDFDDFPPHTHKRPQLSHKYRRQEVHQQEPPLTPTLSSLLRRIASLESSFLRLHSPGNSSLRDAAARTIQTHFRAFLVRRSKTLRHLKELAFIKSALNTLKSSVSKRTHFDYQLVSREATNLLVELDSIQDGDPLIRDGKRSISRELIRFMEFIEEISPKSRVISVKNVRFGKHGSKTMVLQHQQKLSASDSNVLGGNERKILEKLRNKVKKINGFSNVSEEEEVELENPSVHMNGTSRMGATVKSRGEVKSQPKVKKNVSFAENENVYRVIRSSHGPVPSDESDSINGYREGEETGVSSKETEEEEEANTEDEEEEEEESLEMSDNERDPRKNLRTRTEYMLKKEQPDQEEEDEEEDEDDDDSFVFSAPLPVKMEYSVNKKQPVKT